MSLKKQTTSLDHPSRLRPSMSIHIPRHSPDILKKRPENIHELTSQFEGLGKRKRTDLHTVQRKRFKKKIEKLSLLKYKCLNRVRILQNQLFTCTKQKQLIQIIADRNQTQHELTLLRLKQSQLVQQVRNLKK